MKRTKQMLVLGVAVAMLGATFSFASCGEAEEEATQTFLFSAQEVYEGTTYKINLKGMSDGSCSLRCLQSEDPLDLEGTYTFSDTEGYSFDFGTTEVISAFNDGWDQHYVLLDVDLTSSYTVKVMLTYDDSTFAPGDSYTDPYTAKASMVFEGELTDSDEESFILRDYGDGTFDVMSYGSSTIFDYGTTYTDSDGNYVFLLSDGETSMTREVSETVDGAYAVIYLTTSTGFFSTSVSNYLYYLNGSDKDTAFPDFETTTDDTDFDFDSI